MNEHEWEVINETVATTTFRLKIEGGWLYQHIKTNMKAIAMCFVPDSPKQKFADEEFQKYLSDNGSAKTDEGTL